VKPEEADWVYDVVLTQRYKESTGCIMWTGAREKRRDEGPGKAMVRKCECEYGLCGRCSDGRPDRCAHRDWTPPTSPETWIQNPRGLALTAVWRAGAPCHWLCPTASTGVDPGGPRERVPAGPRRPKVIRGEHGYHYSSSFGQLELFAVGGAR
jgi:hypothetical protein